MINRTWRSRILSSVFVLSLAFVLGGWLWAYSALWRISQPLIIHFNNFIGIDRVGGLRDLSAIGVAAILGVLINFLIALELEEYDQFWSRLLAAATLVMSILIFIGFAAIINVN